VHDAEQGKEFKAQVLEYMPNGSLESWLYPKVNKYIWIEKIIEFGFRIMIAMNIAFCIGLFTQLMRASYFFFENMPEHVF
jgi:hypothetical protein